MTRVIAIPIFEFCDIDKLRAGCHVRSVVTFAVLCTRYIGRRTVCASRDEFRRMLNSMIWISSIEQVGGYAMER